VYMSEDQSLRQDVERELDWEPLVRSAEIGVGVRDGIVTLSGVMDSHAAKRAAEHAAARVPGVRAVNSQLQVGPSAQRGRSDADIAWAAANVLAWNALVPADRIHIEVSNGWVTLEGAVEWGFQRTAAADVVADIAGVVGVTNMIVVSQNVPAEFLKQEVEAALQRDSQVLGRRLVVEAQGDCVTLWGSVNSERQREAAERAAWSVSGVRDVSNHITVQSRAAAAAK